MASGRPRIIFDVTTSCCWSGPPTGIVRVEREYALWARRHLAAAEFAFFDPVRRVHCKLHDRLTTALLEGGIHVDGGAMSMADGDRRHFIDRVPPSLRPISRWILQFRRQLLTTLELRRIGATRSSTQHRLDIIQRIFMTEKYRRLMLGPDGGRRQFLPIRAIRGDPIELASTDTLVLAGAPWAHLDMAAVAALKRERRFKLAILCHDIMPLQFPHFWKDHDVAAFRRHYDVALRNADLALAASHRIGEDLAAYCRKLGIPPVRFRLVPFGCDPVSVTQSILDIRSLGLEPDKYALFVSTIEPRKGHKVLLEAWRRLRHSGLVAQHGFKLVFVGREGWKVDDLLSLIRSEVETGTVVHFLHADDQTLGALYRHAAFCTFPSLYEGFGLSVIEAFSHGKAVIASTGGALPEVVDGYSPCLDPLDVELWTATLGAWIAEPGARRPYEEAIRTSFRPTSWTEAAKAFFAAIETA